MLSFYAKSYTKQLAAVVQCEQELADDVPQALGRAASQLRELGRVIGAAGFPHIEQRTERMFQEWTSGKLTRDVALYETRGVRAALVAELGMHLYFVVPAGDRDYYEKPLLPKDAASAFPTADEELQLAGRCLVLDQPTATVYHAMRALEAGLNAFARQLEVPPSDRSTWGPIIDRIETAINNARQGKLTSERRSLLDAYADAATHFRFLKDAWRNHAMHQRQNYDRDKAEDILRHVSQFLEQLAGVGIKEPT